VNFYALLEHSVYFQVGCHSHCPTDRFRHSRISTAAKLFQYVYVVLCYIINYYITGLPRHCIWMI